MTLRAARRAIAELLAIAPRLAGLLAALARDPRVPGRVKVILGAALAYLASPLDLIPDVIPVLGYADDLLVAALVIDGVLTHVARAVLLDHWPGDAASLDRAGRVAARLVAWIPRRLRARVFRGATA